MKIYAARITDLGIPMEKMIEKLDSDRQGKIARLQRQEDKMRSICAGGLLRFAMMQEGCSQEEWKQLEIRKGENGKPFIVGKDKACFSLSHSGEWVVCAIHMYQIGIDLQERRVMRKAVAHRFYSQRENEWLNEVENEEERRLLFYQMWCAKESYGKMTGEGIAKGLRHMEVDRSLTRIKNTDTKKDAKLKMYELAENYCLCVCIEQGEFAQKVTFIPQVFLDENEGGDIC